MILAKFHWGPYDGEYLTLPTEDPWPKFMIPARKNKLIIEHFYLLTGLLEEDFPVWGYLYECELDSLLIT